MLGFVYSVSPTLQRSGIDKLIPGVVVDDRLFEPCGYSMNGLMRNVPVSALLAAASQDVADDRYRGIDQLQ